MKLTAIDPQRCPVAASCQKETSPVSLRSVPGVDVTQDNDLACRTRCNARLLDGLQRIRVNPSLHGATSGLSFKTKTSILRCILHIALNQFYSVLRPETDPSVCMG